MIDGWGNDWETFGFGHQLRRLRVPGGWIVASGVALCFVPDPSPISRWLEGKTFYPLPQPSHRPRGKGDDE